MEIPSQISDQDMGFYESASRYIAVSVTNGGVLLFSIKFRLLRNGLIDYKT